VRTKQKICRDGRKCGFMGGIPGYAGIITWIFGCLGDLQIFYRLDIFSLDCLFGMLLIRVLIEQLPLRHRLCKKESFR